MIEIVTRAAEGGNTLKAGYVKRILVTVSVPVILILLWIYEYNGGSGMTCPFYRLTGLYCPGCGSGRAVQALYHGHIAQAVRYNILLPLFGLPSLAVLAHEYLRIVFPALKLRPVYVSQTVVRAVIVIVIVFWVLRNVPALSVLAPG